MELAFFGFAVWGLYAAGDQAVGLAMAVAVVLHYAVSYDRIRWLLGFP